ncbi:unnamed protein product [Phytomonas sp. EM1]|nr:unnamed protein product [Phytomonas sp. EM1]|eukprot:CCW60342.1 unnamed protein product [Phytomonas sp. isolate EM1]
MRVVTKSKSPRRNIFVYSCTYIQHVIKALFLFLAFLLIFMSWYCTRSLPTPINGKWSSKNTSSTLLIRCNDSNTSGYQASYDFVLTDYNFHIFMFIVPLTNREWLWIGKSQGGVLTLHHSDARLLFSYDRKDLESNLRVFVRVPGHSSTFFTHALRAKSKYLLSLFFLIFAYNFFQITQKPAHHLKNCHIQRRKFQAQTLN